MTMKKRKKEKTIFRTILFAMLLVLGIEIVLLVSALYLSNVSTRLNQNAMDLLDMQTNNRSDYLESILLFNQDLSRLSSCINEKASELSAAQKLDLSRIGDSSAEALPLLEEISSAMISTLRSKSVTGVFVAFTTEEFSKSSTVSAIPGMYLRDLDPTSPASAANDDLFLERSPIALVRSMGISTDKSWTTSFDLTQKPESAFLTPVFLATWADHGALDADNYGRWTILPYTLSGDDRPAIAYTIPLITSDGTIYGVVGIEMLVSYLQSLLPYSELQNESNGTYLLFSASAASLNSEPPSQIICRTAVCSTGNGMTLFEEEKQAFKLKEHPDGSFWLRSDGSTYYVSVTPLTLYSRNAPFSDEQWALAGTVQASNLFHFSRQLLRILMTAIVLTLFVGLVSSLITSRLLAHPVSQLSAEVAVAQKNREKLPTLSRTGIRELDQFSQAITQLSQDILTTSTKFLRIMEMASIELGGYEMRFDLNTVYVTKNFFPMLNLPSEDVSGLSTRYFQQMLREFDQTHSHTVWVGHSKVYEISFSDGTIRYIRMETSREGYAQIGLVEDFTSVMLERQRIEHERDYDALTGLYNRRAFQRESEALFEHSEVLGHAALLMIDLDNLKRTNDTFGHDWGDAYIRQAGQCFISSVPAKTLCARISGDEFNLLFYGYQSQEEIRALLQNLSLAVSNTALELPSGRKLPLRLSGGVSWYPENSTDLSTLKKYADFAMYQVKKAEKGYITEFDLELFTKNAKETEMRRLFHKMLNEELFTYYFQPIVSAADGSIYAYEALMRGNLPALTRPDQILQLAHEEECLHEIERLTMFLSAKSYATFLSTHQIRGDELLFVNSIASQYMNHDESVAYVEQYSFLQDRIVIEITEEDSQDLTALLKKREMPGFSGVFALDDYGSGYSNEKTLLELAPAYIKLDLSIIRDIDSDPDKQQIVENIVSYAHQRGMKIIAEGLETPAELLKVLELDVDLLQGYFLAKPSAVPKPVSAESVAVIEHFRKYHA